MTQQKTKWQMVNKENLEFTLHFLLQQSGTFSVKLQEHFNCK